MNIKSAPDFEGSNQVVITRPVLSVKESGFLSSDSMNYSNKYALCLLVKVAKIPISYSKQKA